MQQCTLDVGLSVPGGIEGFMVLDAAMHGKVEVRAEPPAKDLLPGSDLDAVHCREHAVNTLIKR